MALAFKSGLPTTTKQKTKGANTVIQKKQLAHRKQNGWEDPSRNQKSQSLSFCNRH